MPVLVKVEKPAIHSGVKSIERVSTEPVNLSDYHYKKLVTQIDPLQYQMPTVYGGLARLQVGNITFSPEFFADYFVDYNASAVTDTITEADATFDANWSTTTAEDPAYAEGGEYEETTTTDATVSYTFKVPATGEWKVLVRIPEETAGGPNGGAFDTAALYTVKPTTTGSFTKIVDQTANNGESVLLGYFQFEAGIDVTVKIDRTSDSTDTTVTDSITFTLADDPDTTALWVPPTTMDMQIGWSTTSETAAVWLADLTGHYVGENASGIRYQLFNSDFKDSTYSSKALSGTLENVLETDFNDVLTGYATTLYSISAGAASIPISYTISDETQKVDIIDDILKYCGCIGWVENDTIYILQVSDDTETEVAIAGRHFGASYSQSIIKDINDETYYDGGGISYGQSVQQTSYHSTQAYIETRLAANLAILQKTQCNLSIPIDSDLIPDAFEQYLFIDESQYKPTEVTLHGRGVSFNFAADTMIIDGWVEREAY